MSANSRLGAYSNKYGMSSIQINVTGVIDFFFQNKSCHVVVVLLSLHPPGHAMKIRRIIVTSFRVMGSGSGYNWVVVFAAARVGVHVARTERLETASAHKLRCWCTAIVAVSFTQHLM